MGYSQEHTKAVRKRILDCAGRGFRQHGYGGVGIDKIMAEAGLTRGGFYLHFKSKQALFRAVIADDFDFTNQVRRLQTMPELGSDRAMIAFTAYLDPARRQIIGDACTMATLGAEIGRWDDDIKEAYSAGLDTLLDELKALFHADGIRVRKAPIRSILSTAVGALTMARAMPDDEAEHLMTSVLADIRRAVDGWKTPI